MPSVPPIQETPTRVPAGRSGGCAFDDFADDLVAEDEGLVDEGEVAFEDVEVGAADSAGEDAEEDVAWGEGGAWGRLRFGAADFGVVEDGCFHGSPLGYSFRIGANEIVGSSRCLRDPPHCSWIHEINNGKRKTI